MLVTFESSNGKFFLKDHVFLLIYVYLKSVFGGRHRKTDFLPIFNIKRQWGTRGNLFFFGGEKPNIKQIVKKKIGEKISKIGEIGKKIEFFLLKIV